MPDNPNYDVKPVHVPRLGGMSLSLAVALIERPAIRALAAPLLTRGLGLPELRAAEIDEAPTFMPLYSADDRRAEVQFNIKQTPRQSLPNPGFRFRRIRDYEEAYRSGSATPEQVGERALRAIASSDGSPQPLRAFIACDHDDVMMQAGHAAQRWKEGRPLGPLDGVPIAVKDELDMVPYPTTAGTRFLGGRKGAGRFDSRRAVKERRSSADW